MIGCNVLVNKVYYQLSWCAARGLRIGAVPITNYVARGGAREEMDTLTGSFAEGGAWPERCTRISVSGPASE